MKTLAMLIILPLLFAYSEQSTAADAPTFTLEDVDGEIVNLDELLEKGPVMMSFWALWCKMCIKELDGLKPYAEEFDSLNITLLAISQDKTRSVPKVKPFATSHKWTYRIVLDPENMMRDLYNVQAMPTFFIIDQNRKIVFTHQGYKPGDEEIIIAKVRELYEQGGQCEQ
ncbi:MAG: TlpA family protein disulfide reductase [candidate division WOR-3 bacterium]|nr:MAG: TlpA family protein disulfide reductase [candidate division WOR-3 bacterium]